MSNVFIELSANVKKFGESSEKIINGEKYLIILLNDLYLTEFGDDTVLNFELFNTDFVLDKDNIVYVSSPVLKGFEIFEIGDKKLLENINKYLLWRLNIIKNFNI